MDRRQEIVKRFNETKTISKEDFTYIMQEMNYWKNKYACETETLRKNNSELKRRIGNVLKNSAVQWINDTLEGKRS